MNSEGNGFKLNIKQQEEHQPERVQNQESYQQIKGLQLGFGQWNEKQIWKYFLFVYHNKKKFHSKPMRKSMKIFKLMAKFIKSRNSCQCRTHHQNVLKKSKTLDNAIKKFISANPRFMSNYEKHKNLLKMIDDYQFCQDTSTVVRQAKIEGNNNPCEGPEEVNFKNYPYVANTMSSFAEQQEFYVSINEARNRKIIECQHYFNEWIRKVNQLTFLEQL